MFTNLQYEKDVIDNIVYILFFREDTGFHKKRFQMMYIYLVCELGLPINKGKLNL